MTTNCNCSSLPPPQPLRMVLVDDSEPTRNLVAENLRVWCPGPDLVGTAVDGLEAIEAVRTNRPDLILMDVVMPRMNGIDAALQIRKEFPATRIVLYSTHTLEAMQGALHSCGADAFVPKASLSRQFCDVVRQLCGTCGQITAPGAPAR